MSQIIVENTHSWRLSGELTFATVGELLKEFSQYSPFGGESKETQTQSLVLNLSDVTRTDSAGLAFLIELLKKTKNKPITFQNIPAQMHNLATLSGVQDMLSKNSE
ncbi:STAS domain-containing protein [Candidatus Parabeggiatoa sp. HSG14]|uniref:STAS domain-containing protein n=1 Tax=Candidatus Parabeggiatoa sp. HSG14 TaxID=3055593 RepID=UPI0025A6EA50|nr:STAS domain-containing protein [Thiotrichales bacterium HSG14]